MHNLLANTHVKYVNIYVCSVCTMVVILLPQLQANGQKTAYISMTGVKRFSRVQCNV